MDSQYRSVLLNWSPLWATGAWFHWDPQKNHEDSASELLPSSIPKMGIYSPHWLRVVLWAVVVQWLLHRGVRALRQKWREMWCYQPGVVMLQLCKCSCHSKGETKRWAQIQRQGRVVFQVIYLRTTNQGVITFGTCNHVADHPGFFLVLLNIPQNLLCQILWYHEGSPNPTVKCSGHLFLREVSFLL